MRRLELHPVDLGLLAIRPQPGDGVLDRAAVGVAGVALGHNHEIGVEFVLHIDGGAVAHDSLAHRNDGDPGILRLAFALDRLVVDADAGKAGPDAVATRRRTAMMPPCPVSPSTLTGIDTL